jgi:hypothetical protein
LQPKRENLWEKAMRLIFAPAALAVITGTSLFANAAQDECPPPLHPRCPPERKYCVEDAHPYHCEARIPEFVPKDKDLIYVYAGQTYRLSREGGFTPELAETCPDPARQYRIENHCEQTPEEFVTKDKELVYSYKGQTYRLRQETAVPNQE